MSGSMHVGGSSSGKRPEFVGTPEDLQLVLQRVHSELGNAVKSFRAADLQTPGIELHETLFRLERMHAVVEGLFRKYNALWLDAAAAELEKMKEERGNA